MPRSIKSRKWFAQLLTLFLNSNPLPGVLKRPHGLEAKKTVLPNSWRLDPRNESPGFGSGSPDGSHGSGVLGTRWVSFNLRGQTKDKHASKRGTLKNNRFQQQPPFRKPFRENRLTPFLRNPADRFARPPAHLVEGDTAHHRVHLRSLPKKGAAQSKMDGFAGCRLIWEE